METSLIALGLICFILLIIIGLPILIYNELVSLRNNVRKAFAGVHVQLKRRTDLIPNLVETVKGYVKHEHDVLENITRLRTEFLKTNPENRDQIIEQNSSIVKALKSIFAVSEAYPDLKASENYLKLQEEITETEDQIAASRRIYNSNVADYNTAIEQFPASLIANHFNFKEEPFFNKEDSSM